ncbi:MAG: DUF1127 domain-containing protein [Pseudomonadota bacterium]
MACGTADCTTGNIAVAHRGRGARTGWPGLLARWAAARRERSALARLDARMLDDVGLSEETARREAARPFWDLPGQLR